MVSASLIMVTAYILVSYLCCHPVDGEMADSNLRAVLLLDLHSHARQAHGPLSRATQHLEGKGGVVGKGGAIRGSMEAWERG